MKLLRSKKSLLFIFIGLFLPCMGATEFEKAIQFASAHNWQAATPIFRKLAKQQPDNAVVFYNLGTALAQQKQYPEAIWALEKALKLNPTLKAAKLNIFWCYSKLEITDPWENSLSFFQEKAYLFGIQKWLIATCISSLVTGFFLYQLLTSTRTNTRKVSLIIGIFSLFIFLFSLRYAVLLYQYTAENSHLILNQTIFSVYNDELGNRRIPIHLSAGLKFPLAGETSSRYGIEMKNQTVIWIEKNEAFPF